MCGCGGKSNVYKPPALTADGSPAPAPARGLPKVWNGPKPKVAAPKP